MPLSLHLQGHFDQSGSKSKDTLFDTLSLSFGNGVINNMRLVDSVGQRTDILFSGVKANQPVPASTFKFDIPKGADVIQE